MSEIGRILKERRLALGLEIEDIAKTTCINPHYIRAMEDGKFQIIPKVFDRGYLKIYANFLRIDSKQILSLYDQKRSQIAGQFSSPQTV